MSKLLLRQRLSRPMPYSPRMPAPQTPLAAALERVGDRWSLLLIEALLDGPRRFGELTEATRSLEQCLDQKQAPAVPHPLERGGQGSLRRGHARTVGHRS